MSIRQQRAARPTAHAARLLASLVVLMLLVRFAIPAGFMPGPSSHAGELVLSLCAGQSGATSLTSEHDDEHDGLAMPCPFAVLAWHGLLPDTPLQPAMGAPGITALALIALRAVPTLPACGPPLGSRAPPLRLV